MVNCGFQIIQEKEEAHSPYTAITGIEKDSVCVKGGGSNAMPSGDQNTVLGAVENKKLFRMFGSQWY